ncbi:MAG: trypsin-like peptidase domain-containing protein [Halobacteriovoraceae bacterium]|jgi:V8-like Glu-specific endopeptidase|nr:trypsin-like peptidase domain-containing protein [Halobacteriovoraceae bacterium]MBT5094732.1 trypsin-like peptidase domain-containing protein [Halobacteriovoraceae bacterium]
MQKIMLTGLFSFVVGLAPLAAKVSPKVAYGDDNRQEVADTQNSLHAKLALSTAAQIKWSKMNKTRRGYELPTKTLRETFNVCRTERYAKQLAAARCSGFLVAPDLLVTAGHCVPSQSHCNDYAWVFDYREGEIGSGSVSKKSVYKCKKILNQKLDSFAKADYALVQLDREVDDREPLTFRTEGKVSTGTELVVIGHPSGLPTKIAGDASVHANSHQEYFVSDLDTFGGNSGSAVFDAKTGLVEGILVRGAKDYINSAAGCRVVNNCSKIGASGCGGESVSRITRVNIPKYSKSNK